MYRLYSPEMLAATEEVYPIGLGVRQVGEYANFYVGEFFDKGLVRQLAAFLETGELVVAEFKKKGLGVLPGIVAATAIAGKTASVAGLVAKVSGIFKGFSAGKLAARRKKNSSNGFKRAKGYLKKAQAAVGSIATSLGKLGVPVGNNASPAYYAALLKRIGRTKPNQRKYGKRSQRDPFRKFRKLLERTAAQLKVLTGEAVARQPVTSIPVMPALGPPAAAPAPITHQYAGAVQLTPDAAPPSGPVVTPPAATARQITTQYAEAAAPPAPKPVSKALLIGLPLAVTVGMKLLGGK